MLEAQPEAKTGSWDEEVHLRLLKARKVFLTGEVDMALAHRVMAELMFLEELGKDPIRLYINSPGGELPSGLAIYDTLKSLQCEVHTICAGLAASIATVVLAGGAKGNRASYRNARILIHQPIGGVRGQATDIEIHAREILR
ncbi:MAG: ATP-dependent Clp protease proteolytic subunit, partial [Candidatus Riflebacteria bacterium]|nr:ATP-dependent Clp protease proteolytic subunit [Candidatus Riflebacteria bacterium]